MSDGKWYREYEKNKRALADAEVSLSIQERTINRYEAQLATLTERNEELNRMKARTWTRYEMAEAQWTFTFHIHRDEDEEVLAHELAHAVQRFRWPDDEVHSERHAALAESIRAALAQQPARCPTCGGPSGREVRTGTSPDTYCGDWRHAAQAKGEVCPFSSLHNDDWECSWPGHAEATTKDGR